jgi:acetyl esterase
MTIIGRRYLEKGRPVTVLKKWGTGGGPRNVLIEREDGTKVIRPFRGLRKYDKGVAGQEVKKLRCGFCGDEDPQNIRSDGLCGDCHNELVQDKYLSLAREMFERSGK